MACHRDMTFVMEDSTETLNLPVSKTDQSAAGVKRTWGCVCPADASISTPCPYHAGLRLAEEHQARFCGSEGFVAGDAPLFPNSEGGRCTRAGFLATVIAIAHLLKLKTVDNWGRIIFTAHIWRISGARHLYRFNVELPTLMLLARWGSNVVLHYLSDRCPLRRWKFEHLLYGRLLARI